MMIRPGSLQQTIRVTAYSLLLFVSMMYSFLFDGWTHWAEGVQLAVQPDQMLKLIFFLSCFAAILEIPLSGPRALLAALMILFQQQFTITHHNWLLTEMVLLAALSNLNTRKGNCWVWMITHLLYGALLIWFNQKGMVSPVYMPDKVVLGLSITGCSYGMGHPNSFAVYLMSAVMMLWYMLKNRLRWWMTILLYWAGAAGILFLTECRTVSVLLIVFPFLFFLMEWLWKKEWRGLNILAALIPVLILAVSLGISVYVMNAPGNSMDGRFLARFRELHWILEGMFLPFGSDGLITGASGAWIFFDNLYLMLIACCGYIPTVLSLAACCYMMYRLSKERNATLLALTTIFLVYGIMENAVIYSIYFFVPILAFSQEKLLPPVKGLLKPQAAESL